MKGIIFDIKRFAVHDGPGIRTTVFMKGCPLSCWWCHNPESQEAAPSVHYRADSCLQCGRCVHACPAHAMRLGPGGIARETTLCRGCGRCAQACPSEAMTVVGREVTAEGLMAEIAGDRIFFDESGGGITFSGGEPLAQPAFLMEMLDRCGRVGLHRAVDTSGYAPRATLLEVAQRTDLFLFDLKRMDDAAHRHYTGVTNTGILGNLQALSETGAQVEIRVPVIPEVSNGGHIAALGAFLAALPRRHRVRLLPYHRAARHKYERFNKPWRLGDAPGHTPGELKGMAETLRNCGLEVAHE